MRALATTLLTAGLLWMAGTSHAASRPTRDSVSVLDIDISKSPCGDVVVHIPTISVNSLEHVGGDCEMEGHNPAITIEAILKRQESFLVVEGFVRMKESEKDWTEVHSKFSERFFVRELDAPECQFESFNQDKGTLRANGGKNNHNPTRYSGSGLIESALCLSDTKGDDCGKLFAEISFKPVVIRLRPR